MLRNRARLPPLLHRSATADSRLEDGLLTLVLASDSSADRLLLQHHPMRNALTNVVGVGARTDVHVIEERLHGGERIALTTDGVHGVLDEGRVEQLLAEGDIRTASRDLVAAALARGCRDNRTAVVAEYSCPASESVA